MSEWNIIHEISTQNIACSQRQINTCRTSFSYILWAYGEHIMSKWSSRTSDQFIWLVLEKKTEAVNAYLIKNSMGEGGGGGEEEEERERERAHCGSPRDLQATVVYIEEAGVDI